MNETDSKNVNEKSSASPQTTSPLRMGPSCLVRSLGVLALAVFGIAAIYFYQRWFGPEVDPTRTAEIVISSAAKKANAENAVVNEPLPGILAGISEEAIRTAEHPLDPFLDVARKAREKLLREVDDYSAVMMNEIRTFAGKQRAPQYMQIKIRHTRDDANRKIPFSIYTHFLKPKELLGQEAIWIEGQNDGKLIGHPATLNIKRFYLDPKGSLAMGDNRHPIFELGLERLLNQVIEKGERDRKVGTCEVSFERDVNVNGVRCLKIIVRHPIKQEPFDFHLAIIYVDIERQIPIGYEGFDWPSSPGGEPELIERYFYSDIEVNKGFTDLDWDPANPEYKFPRF
ncbi:MAG: DUF1571 domain-containing protein [Pirellulaceae bacterium]